MKKFSILALLAILLLTEASSQMNFKGQILFGNEWINYSQPYFKFFIQEDGFYRLDYQDFVKAGIPIQTIEAKYIRIYKNGEEIALRTSTNELMTEGDYIEFYASYNRAELDAALFRNGIPQFNTEYSMFEDKSAHYLTWNTSLMGRRMESRPNDNSNPLRKEDGYIRRDIISFHEDNMKRAHGPGTSLKFPDFDEGQGFGTFAGNNRTFTLNFPQFNSLGQGAEINIKTFSAGKGDAEAHKLNYFIDNKIIDSITYAGFKVKNQQLFIAAEDLKSSHDLKVTSNKHGEDRYSISTIDIRYEALYKFDNASYSKLIVLPSLTRKTIEIEDFNGGAELWLYDITNGFYIRSEKNSNAVYPINLPSSDNERELVILNPEISYKKINSIVKVDMPSYEKNDYDYMMVTSKRLRNGNSDAVTDYINYRQSNEGGNYKVKLVYIEDIEDQFAYGVRGHNVALRNFFQYSRTIWSKMHYVLIIGKGLEYHKYRTSNDRYDNFDFVHTYSEPAADYLLVSDNDRNPFYTLGRLPVISNEEISNYLNKLKEHESLLSRTNHDIQNREWLKNVVHLAGGDPTLYSTIRSQLAGMENVIENNNFGASVETFYKESTNSVEVINSDKLKDLINNGVSIITFLGHSANFKLDFSLEGIQDYKNKGKYHTFIALGCYAGEMFHVVRSISEIHNLTADKGSVLYIANTTAGLPQILYTFGNDFYSKIGTEFYGKPMGDAVRSVILNLLATKSENQMSQGLSITFNGDPALKLNNNPDVDVTLDGATAKHIDKNIFIDQKEFTFSVDLVNLGMDKLDSVKVQIENVFPDGSKSIVYTGKVIVPSNRQNEKFIIPIDENKSAGYNTLLLTLDPDNILTEGPLPNAEINNSLITSTNQLGFKYVVIANNARILYPSEFAIINIEKPKLVVYNGNLFKKSKYFLELDTTEYFNSSLKRETTIEQLGGAITWQQNEILIPNVVYYWRVRPDSAGTSVLAWKTSSFIYIPGNEIGWNQSHFFQHTKNDNINIEVTDKNRKYEFKNIIREFRLFNGYVEIPELYYRPKIILGSTVVADYEYWNFRRDLSGILIAYIDPIKGDISKNITGSDYNSVGGPNMAGNSYFLYSTATKDDRAKLLDFLKNGIPDKAVVIVQTLVQDNNSLFLQDWASDGPENLIQFFKDRGALNIDKLVSVGNTTYNLVYGKNRPGYETRDKVGNNTEELNLAHSMTISVNSGNVNSSLIGPANSYNKFLWNNNYFEPNSDLSNVEIFGVNKTGSETKLFGPTDVTEIDLKSIDAKIYPFLKLKWNSKDEPNKTSSNLDYWRVYYSGRPDIAFNPAISYKKNFDTLNQGKFFRVDLTARNVSTYDMDSLLIKFTVIDENNVQLSTEYRYEPVKPFEDLKFFYLSKALNKPGAFKLLVELNPNQDQEEFITFNNTAVIDYYVRKDKRKPFVKVLVDGLTINNGEIVSPASKILVLLHDEDNSIPMQNPDHFKIKLEYPDQNITNVDPISLSNVKFVPADTNSSKNEASMIMDGGLVQEGTYKLYVRARDANGNYTSETDEIIEFKVVNESSVSNVFNYPNPFSSKTKFVYTLTGSKIPEFYKIQIMTISGKVVKEITESELGQLRIGTHMTEYEYDGTDDFGDKLANGVYLYRAIFKDSEGREIKKYETGTNSFFTNNLGRMVILR